ncbi:uncharacterized protein [Gossypium hirsutum]|uniref:Uncharacterized protein isoform X1 n=1 Tax=Gossypium hirsutum TaxID=3635 RepID=A0ABM2Z155_GOSHI|nr:uncharacterized protein LOC107924435 isoform X1 [Gossypium hirsutum]
MEFDPYGVNNYETGSSSSSNLPPLSFTVNNRQSIPFIDLNQSVNWRRIDDAYQPFEFTPTDFHSISTPFRIFQPKTHRYPSYGLPMRTSLGHIPLRDCGGGDRGGFFDWEKTKPVYNNCMDPYNLGPHSLESDFLLPRNYNTNQVPFSNPYENPLSWHGITPSDPIPSIKTSPGIAFRPPPPSPVDAFSSANDTLSFKNLNNGINGIDKNSTGKPSVAEKLSKPPNMFSKGASTSYDESPFRTSKPVFVQDAKKHGILDRDRGRAHNYLPMKFSDVVKLPPRKPSGSIRMSVENGKVKDGSTSPSKFNLFPTLPTRKRSNLRKMDLNEDYSLFSQSLDEFDKETSLQQGFAEGKFEAGVADFYTKTNCDSTKHSNFLSKRSFSSYGDSILLERMLVLSDMLLSWCSDHTYELEEKDQKSLEKIINNLHTCMSKSIRQEPSLFSGLSEAGVADFHTKANHIRSDFNPLSRSFWRVNHKIMIDRMLSLSDFLLSLCSNYTYELEENEHKSFEEIINNLHTCISINIVRDSALVSELSDSIPSQKREEKGNHSVSIDSDLKLKIDKTAENIKKILMEDYNVKEEKDPQVRFYKTLWLEAEAALCSVNCMTHFINTKTEIEKSKLDDEKGSSDEDETSSFELNENDESSKTIEPLATACDDEVDKSFKLESGLTQLVSGFASDSSFKLNEKDKLSCDDEVDNSTETAGDTDDEVSQHQDFNFGHAGEQSEVGDFNVQYGCTVRPGSSSGIGDQPTTNWYDDSSTDWEHVSNEEDLFSF